MFILAMKNNKESGDDAMVGRKKKSTHRCIIILKKRREQKYCFTIFIGDEKCNHTYVLWHQRIFAVKICVVQDFCFFVLSAL